MAKDEFTELELKADQAQADLQAERLLHAETRNQLRLERLRADGIHKSLQYQLEMECKAARQMKALLFAIYRLADPIHLTDGE
jgi:hypothetical protein